MNGENMPSSLSFYSSSSSFCCSALSLLSSFTSTLALSILDYGRELLGLVSELDWG